MNITWFSDFPELTTERLVLRQLKISDDVTLFYLRSDDGVNRYIDRRKQSDINETRKFIKKIIDGIKKENWVYWAICLKDRPELIGTICLWNFSEVRATAEIGYELSPSFQGFGYMNEALQCVLGYGFDTLGLNKLEAFTHMDNFRSAKLLEKNLFKHEADRRDAENANNRVYSLSRKA
ncbi:MAG: GNAT family N-acetyltransferase [Cyclobacteriaceae bacterium]|nr:GNAT family N-acetyltransferase [Cyclobacteriaceae bacterium]